MRGRALLNCITPVLWRPAWNFRGGALLLFRSCTRSAATDLPGGALTFFGPARSYRGQMHSGRPAVSAATPRGQRVTWGRACPRRVAALVASCAAAGLE
eukprot:6274493-Pyramimonas_sp.AAC.1